VVTTKQLLRKKLARKRLLRKKLARKQLLRKKLARKQLLGENSASCWKIRLFLKICTNIHYKYIYMSKTQSEVTNVTIKEKQENNPKEITADTKGLWPYGNCVNGTLDGRDFLCHPGIDTVNSRSGGHSPQFKDDGSFPQMLVGPWMQSTYGPDTNGKCREIGGDY
jgi:hypothetical protein